MRKAIAIILVGCGFIFLSCQTKQKQEIPKPAIDMSTPDKAVTSYMRYEGYLEKKMEVEIFPQRDKFYTIGFKKLKNAEHKEFSESLKDQDIKLDSVKIETDSRAVVFLSRFDKIREERQKYKVILEKVGGSWLIDQIYHTCWRCKGTGKRDDLSKTYPWPKITCSDCKGTGWSESVLPSIPFE